MRFIAARRVTRFRAADKYTLFRVDGHEHLVRDSLESLEERLAPLGFIRVHRSELVRRDACVALFSEPGGASLELSDGSMCRESSLPRDRQARSRRDLN